MSLINCTNCGETFFRSFTSTSLNFCKQCKKLPLQEQYQIILKVENELMLNDNLSHLSSFSINMQKKELMEKMNSEKEKLEELDKKLEELNKKIFF